MKRALLVTVLIVLALGLASGWSLSAQPGIAAAYPMPTLAASPTPTAPGPDWRVQIPIVARLYRAATPIPYP